MAIPYSQNDYEVLKKTIYAEARGESKEGQIAVAHVILTRVKTPKYNWPNTIEGVCKQKWQFECWNGKSDIHIGEPQEFSSIDSWLPDVLSGRIGDPTGGCDHYNNPKKENPSWVNNVRHVMDIGNHRFYKSY